MVHGNPISLDPMLKSLPRMITPSWCLELVLVTSSKAPFQPIMSGPLKYLTWKTAFLLAITSAQRASELHVQSCEPAYLRFSSAGMTLFTKLIFLPKVPTRTNTTCPIFVPASTTIQIKHSAYSVFDIL